MTCAVRSYHIHITNSLFITLCSSQFTRSSRRRRTPVSPEAKQLPIDKSVLIDKLCRAHRKLAKMEEKADFTEEHIRELTEEIRKKSR